MQQVIRKYRVKEHSDIKDQLLLMIHSVHRTYGANWANMTSCDLGLYESVSGYVPIYRELVMDIIQPYLLDYVKTFDRSEVNCPMVWYSQYHRDGSSFKWHTHKGMNASAIYYVQLEDSQDATEFYGTKLDPIEEGDLVVFPAMLPHRAPPSNRKKTVIGIGMDI